MFEVKSAKITKKHWWTLVVRVDGGECKLIVTENKRQHIVDGVNRKDKWRIEELRRRVVVRKKLRDTVNREVLK